MKSDLDKYINEKNPNLIAFLAIFDKQTNKHIGNGKFEPIDITEKFAVMGLFIGNMDFRVKGVSKEFIEYCVQNILLPRGIKKILLGVNKQNMSAIKAYYKAGFWRSKVSRLDVGFDSIELELRI